MSKDGLLETLLAHASARPTQPALVSETRTITYRELAQIVVRGRQHFLAIADQENCLVGVSIADEWEHFVASLAVTAACLSQITLASYETPGARARLAARAGVTHVLSNEVLSNEDGYRVHNSRFLYWPGSDNLPATGPSERGVRSLPLVHLPTTGTTLDANILSFSEQHIALQAERHPEYADERLLRLAPVEFNTSKRHRLYCLWRGGANVFRPSGSLSEVVAFAARRGVTCLDVSRMHLAEILALQDSPLPKHVKLRPGGGPVGAELRRRILDEVTPNLYVRYAATECGPISMAGPSDHDDDATSGAPLPGVDVQIVGDDGLVSAQGMPGEIRIRAPGMATGYLGNPAIAIQRFRDGWFYPGDVGRLRLDGQIIVSGRKDDMIILNGVNIFPEEIETVLERHPDVEIAAALPIESPVHGQIPVAAVELRAGAVTTPAELLKYARERLALRTPRRILVVEEMPRNEQGKVLKREIRDKFRTDR